MSRVEAPAALSALLISGRAADNDALPDSLADRCPSAPHVRQRVSTLLGANLGVSPHRRPFRSSYFETPTYFLVLSILWRINGADFRMRVDECSRYCLLADYSSERVMN